LFCNIKAVVYAWYMHVTYVKGGILMKKVKKVVVTKATLKDVLKVKTHLSLSCTGQAHNDAC